MNLTLRKVLAVARFEFVSTVTRWGYLLALLGTPLFVGAIGALTGGITSRAVIDQMTKARTVGLIDESGLFAGIPARLSAEVDLERGGRRPGGSLAVLSAELRRFPALDEARRALAASEVDAVIHVPADYLERGAVRELRRARRAPDFSGSVGTARLFGSAMREALVQGRIEPRLAARILRPADWQVLLLEPDGAAVPQDLLRELRNFLVPLGFTLLLLLSIFTSASLLATGLSEERQNRALELFLTALTPEQLFWGKLLGLGGAALLQFLLYLGAVALPAALLYAALGLNLGQALVAFGYFLLGFTFFGAMLLTAGSIGNTQKYTQQLSGAFTFFAMVPMMVTPVLLQDPSGGLARAFTFIPFTAPLTGMLRAGAGALPWWEFALSLLVLGASTVLVVRVSARIFRASLLAAGNLPSVGQVWEWMRG